MTGYYIGRPDFATMTSTNGPHLTGETCSIASARKKSKDYENSIHSSYPTDMLNTEDPSRLNERKKSGSSNTSKGKDREKSEGSIYFLSDETKNSKVKKEKKIA